MAFSLLLCVEAVLLITYNEGLPWYIGYGRYTRTGPHGGTVAPYGAIRASSPIPTIAAVDVYLLDRFTDVPARVRASKLDVVIHAATKRRMCPFMAAGSDGDGASHFMAPAAVP